MRPGTVSPVAAVVGNSSGNGGIQSSSGNVGSGNGIVSLASTVASERPIIMVHGIPFANTNTSASTTTSASTSGTNNGTGFLNQTAQRLDEELEKIINTNTAQAQAAALQIHHLKDKASQLFDWVQLVEETTEEQCSIPHLMKISYFFIHHDLLPLFYQEFSSIVLSTLLMKWNGSSSSSSQDDVHVCNIFIHYLTLFNNNNNR